MDLQEEDPFKLLEMWLEEAAATEPNDPTAAALGTVSQEGFPSVRMVLVKAVTPQGIDFYTNFTSRKAVELDSNRKAGLCFHWKSLRRQIRIVGTIERIDEEMADSYYKTRPYESQIGAWASDQSSPLESREFLISEVERFSKKYPKTPPRPPHWGGYRLIPFEIEFWHNGEARLHDRFQFLKENKGWTVRRLCP